VHREDIIELISQSIDDVNAEREASARIAFSESVPLTGAGSPLDSLDFVNFTTSLEERLRRQNGKGLDLSTVLFDASEPFRSVGRLADFLAAQP
jgi:hypothetical protein